MFWGTSIRFYLIGIDKMSVRHPLNTQPMPGSATTYGAKSSCTLNVLSPKVLHFKIKVNRDK